MELVKIVYAHKVLSPSNNIEARLCKIAGIGQYRTLVLILVLP